MTRELDPNWLATELAAAEVNIERWSRGLRESYEAVTGQKVKDGWAAQEARIAELEARLAEVDRERRVLLNGLNEIVNCQSGLTRSAVREAAADIIKQAGRKATSLSDMSPFVTRAADLEARLAEALSVIEPFARAGALFPDTDACVAAGYVWALYAPAAGDQFNITSDHVRAAAAFFAAEKEKRDA